MKITLPRWQVATFISFIVRRSHTLVICLYCLRRENNCAAHVLQGCRSTGARLQINYAVTTRCYLRSYCYGSRRPCSNLWQYLRYYTCSNEVVNDDDTKCEHANPKISVHEDASQEDLTIRISSMLQTFIVNGSARFSFLDIRISFMTLHTYCKTLDLHNVIWLFSKFPIHVEVVSTPSRQIESQKLNDIRFDAAQPKEHWQTIK